MTQTVRQNNLFAAEDYAAIYESYVNANLQAYDYDTIRTSMVDYVRSHYPENYNDWIESAEFVAMLDLIAQFGHNLAFRVDLNSRNNFLSTADRQEAVFKLAEFLGYSPRRNLPASGQMKVVSVKTNETVIGSQGSSLGGIEIRYEDTDDVDNLDDFLTVLNAALSPSNQFGSPRKQVTLNGVINQLYALNNTKDQIKFDTSGSVLGSSSTFNIIGQTYDSERKNIVETEPRPKNAFNIVYKNDGKGITSNQNGFFVGLKQGDLQYKDFNIDTSIDNMSLDIDVDNINEHDVWVQTIDVDGNVVKSWTKVSSVYGSNVAYNPIAGGERDIFSVKTREDNRVSVQFPDSRFGNLPNGLIRVWYRTSSNNTYIVRPEDVGTKKIRVDYIGIDGNIYTLVLEVQLKESIANASASESLDDIKTNAPRIYATQDRMITAQDYSSYLVRQSDNILKIKSVNRTHSGHSRYVEYNDPTGAYSNLNIYGTDGRLTRERLAELNIVGDIATSKIIEEQINQRLADSEILSAYYVQSRAVFENLALAYNTTPFVWTDVVTINDISTGFFGTTSTAVESIGTISNKYLKYISEDATIKFTTPSGDSVWAKVTSITNYGLGIDNNLGAPTGKTVQGYGAITLDRAIPQDSVIEIIYPAFTRRLNTIARDDIAQYINDRESFVVYYNVDTLSWVAEISTVTNPQSSNFPDFTSNSDSWYFCFIPSSSTNEYFIYRRIIRHMISSDTVKFSNVSSEYFLDEDSNKRSRDSVAFLTLTANGETRNTAYVGSYGPNGELVLVMEDKNRDGRPDSPTSLSEVLDGDLVKEDLRFEWTHVPAVNEIIDPSFTNIVDVFALTRTYDTEYRRYLSDATGSLKEPLMPTIDELNQQFTQVNNKKAMSDKIVYRPVKYKPLFGDKARPENQGRLRVIQVPGSNITDSELKSRVVTATKEFFNLSNWDFGETFYFTELSAYIHQQLPGAVSSVVLVPEGSDRSFGDMFQIIPETNEIFIPDIDVNSIDIINSINDTTIRA